MSQISTKWLYSFNLHAWGTDVVIIDSDFWHKHPKRFIMPATNYDYWSEKIAGNAARDRKLTKELKSQGWKVIRIWEYDVKHNFEKSIQKIVDAISK